ncbi:hypothetical protein ACVWZM_004144 [Bradyrhizobium sp. USDA 4501]
MKITVSLNEQAALKAQGGKAPDLKQLIIDNSRAQVLRVFGRGRFASIEATGADLNRLRTAMGNLCVFSVVTEAQPF